MKRIFILAAAVWASQTVLLAAEKASGVNPDSVVAERTYAQPLAYRDEPPGYRDRIPTARDEPPGYRTRLPQQVDQPFGSVERIPNSAEIPRNYRGLPPNFIEKDSLLIVNNDPSKRMTIDDHPGSSRSDSLRLNSEDLPYTNTSASLRYESIDASRKDD